MNTDTKNVMFDIPIAKGWTWFRDIPEGAHFEDNHRRKFIKLKLQSACGHKFKALRVWDGIISVGIPNPNDTFNAVDYDGIGGKCPEWCPFKIIKQKKLS
jgi:hypothetical protein